MVRKRKDERAPLGRFLVRIHDAIKSANGNCWTQQEIANKVGISHRAYSEYLRGNVEPVGMVAILRLLALLPNHEMLALMEDFREVVSREIDAWSEQVGSNPNETDDEIDPQS